MEFIHGIKNSNRIRKLLKTKSNLKLAVAFWGYDALEMIKGVEGKIVIICNLSSGATNPFVIETLRDNSKIDVRDNAKLHAKVYKSNDMAVVGSANISANGLSYEGDEIKGWIEAGVVVEDAEQLREIDVWFNKLFEASIEITSDMLKNAKTIWNLRRKNIAPPNGGKGISLLDRLKLNRSEFEDKKIYLVLYQCDDISKKAKNELNIAKKEYDTNSKIDCYQGWLDYFPEGAIIIDYPYTTDGKYIFGGYWEVRIPKHVRRFKDDDGSESGIILVYETNFVYGYELSQKDRTFIESNYETLRNNTKNIEDGRVISFYDLYDLLNLESQ